jgi:hypothetical protein
MAEWTMLSPFFDVGYRVVAMTLCVSSCRQVWSGLAERKITSSHLHADILDWLLDWSRRQVFYRDTMPIRYWMEIVIQTLVMVGCLVAAIVGWWRPNA